MIKLCEVLAFNKITHIVIAMYGDTRVQFVTDKNSVGSSVYIKKDASHYEIVDKTEYEKSQKATKRKVKVETVTEVIEETVTDSELA